MPYLITDHFYIQILGFGRGRMAFFTFEWVKNAPRLVMGLSALS